MSMWRTARDLAGLPGMPGTERRARERLQQMGLPSRPRCGRGGGQEFDCTALPQQTRQALMLAQVTREMETPAPVDALQTDSHGKAQSASISIATDHVPSLAERAVADARALLIRELLDLRGMHGTKRAVALLALRLASGDADTALLAAARIANQRPRDTAVKGRTLERWLAIYRDTGWRGLLPVPAAPVMEIDPNVAKVLALFATKDARFRNLSDAAREIARRTGQVDEWRSLYSRARRALARVDRIDLVKARHSASERAALLPFRRRDTSSLAPLDVALVDGHTFKAKVRHPDHGAPFAPEVTVVKDAATRLITGWSVSLSENVIAVGDALRHAVGQFGVPAIIYSDNGAGETAKQLDCPITGVIARLGSEHRTGIPGNPQARGLIERGWQASMLACARQFATYQGSDVDAGTLRKVGAELAREQRALKRAEATGEVIALSPKAPSWAQFVDAVGRAVHAFNTEHRHRGLPKNSSGPHAGKHMTPAEAWTAMLEPAHQVKLNAQELRELFMPAVLRTARRGEVQFFNHVYFARELMQVDGQQVRVHYDIHDPRAVQIYTIEGTFLCQADFAANKAAFFPQPVVERAREKRVAARMKRLEGQMDLAQRELQGPHSALDVVSLPQATPLTAAPDVLVLPVTSNKAPVRQVERPVFFDTPSDRYEWLMGHRDAWTDDDSAWLGTYVRSKDYRDLNEYYAGRGLAWQDPDHLMPMANGTKES